VTTGNELVCLTVLPNESEAELVRGLLATADIPSMQRQTDFAAGALDGANLASGPREVLVHARDLEAARELIGGT
jgi:hypothetical protein